MKHQTFEDSTVRELTMDELGLVAGGKEAAKFIDNNLNGYFDDGDDLVITASASSVQSGYWEIGYAFGLGFGLWGYGDRWGISWNAGLGVYATAGVSSLEDARDVTRERIDVVVGSTDSDLSIDWEHGLIDAELSAGGGIVAKSPDGPRFYDDPYIQ